ncbi:aspartate/glutamate racemase family protein [Paenibacillus sp. sgz500958]|uniref:aspartate/glutamate racemase family protein n=1 Tax=Paenibacillus sp. sgz500958 TaxID=3242475 RepID=UPI0036D24406
MRTIGLIGGMSWESSLLYYKIINERVKKQLGGLHSAQCLMYSVDFTEVERLQHYNEWDKLTEMMIDIARRLKNGGADFIVICTNTMHRMAEDIQREAGIDILHIAEATGREVSRQGLKRVGLLGTRFTMEGEFFKQILSEKFGIEAIIPQPEEREEIHRIIYEELCKGDIQSNSKDTYLRVIHNLGLKGAEGVILGCTEISMLINQRDTNIPLFDTTEIHANAAVDLALQLL